MTPVQAFMLRSLNVAFVYGFLAMLALLGAGTVYWSKPWILLGVSGVMLLFNGLVLFRANPDVVIARAESHEGTKRFDKVFGMALVGLTLAVPVVAGLDVVRSGTNDLGTPALLFGLLVLVTGNLSMLWAMVVNRHLERTVRIQGDRDHQVITTGPYAWVRHPMYTGFIAVILATPLVYGSPWALVLALFQAAALVIRTALEDATLHAELPGYAEYAARTRFRLIAGVW